MNHKALILMSALLSLACGDRRGEQEGASRSMEGMPGMGAMSMQSDSLMPIMRAHLDSLATTPATSLAGMVSAHDAMVSQMLDAMGSDMRMMNMQPDSAWMALTDSVKRDLAELPSLSAATLEARVRAHVERMRRLLERHERMMKM